MMSKILRNSFCSILFYVGFIWLHTFIRLSSYTYNSGMSGYILKASITVVATVFYYWCFIGILDPLECLGKVNTNNSSMICDFICLFMTVLLVVELSTDSISIIGEQEIRILWFSISKKYIFDIFAAILFPVIAEYTFKGMISEKLNYKSIVRGIITILMMSLIGYLLFFVMNNIWLVDLAVINISTVTIGAIKYIIPQKEIKKGNVIGTLILYAMACVLFLSFLSSKGSSFSEFMYGTEWSQYSEGVRFIVKNASLFGTSKALLSSAYIHEWLVNRNNYILQLLFYGGWIAVVGLIVFMALFLVLLIQLLGLKNFKIHRHQLIYTASFSILAIRTIMGTLYSFAILPYPVALPFGGTNSIITDSIIFTLILFGAWENFKYEQLITYEIVSPYIFLTKEKKYNIFVDEDEDYQEESVFDRVLVKDAGDGIICDVEWTYDNDREVAVFIPLNNPNHQVFMLEHTKEGEWHPVKDQSIYSLVMRKFIYYRMPDCMEVDDEDYTGH